MARLCVVFSVSTSAHSSINTENCYLLLAALVPLIACSISIVKKKIHWQKTNLSSVISAAIESCVYILWSFIVPERKLKSLETCLIRTRYACMESKRTVSCAKGFQAFSKQQYK